MIGFMFVFVFCVKVLVSEFKVIVYFILPKSGALAHLRAMKVSGSVREMKKNSRREKVEVGCLGV